MKKAFGTGLFLVLLTISPAWAISEAQTAPAPVAAPVTVITPVTAQLLPYTQVPLFETKKTPATLTLVTILEAKSEVIPVPAVVRAIRMTPKVVPTPVVVPVKKQLPSELAKLVYLGELLTHSGLVIIHDSMTYDPRLIYPMVSLYVRMNYKNETAEAWIAKHAYRNGPTYGVIYVKNADGKTVLLKDFLLEALKSL